MFDSKSNGRPLILMAVSFVFLMPASQTIKIPQQQQLQDDMCAESPTPPTAESSFDPETTSSGPCNTQHLSGTPSQPFPPPNFNHLSSEHKDVEHSSTRPKSSSHVQSNKKNSSHEIVVIAVNIVEISFVAAMLFLCCRMLCGTQSVRRIDEGPLISLSLSSSQKSFGLGNRSSKHKPGTNSHYSKTKSSLDSNFYVVPLKFATAGTTLGSVASSAMTSRMEAGQVILPLKPPPGRENPLEASPIGKRAPFPPPIPPPSLEPSGGQLPPPPGAPPPPPPIPVPSSIKTGPRPPPPPSGGVPPPRPPTLGLKPPRPSPLGLKHPSEDGEVAAHKTKLKPFFWDKVLADSDDSMVWHQIKAGSFQFNEEMIETLFGYNSEKNKNAPKKGSLSQDPSTQDIQIIDQKKAQNLSILLKALNVTTKEVCDAIQEGNELPAELLETLIKMAPTEEEELKLRLYSGELSRLGTAEQFLKVLVDVPFSFKRLKSLLFMCTLQEDSSMIKESFATLEAACTELRKSRLFFKLLEAVLKTGSRMNDRTFRGSAQAFKLDTLLKLSNVKGRDGKTTLLHFVVQEIIRSEGLKAARAARESNQSISSIKSDDTADDFSNYTDTEEHVRSLGLEVLSLNNVKKVANLDADSLTGAVGKLGSSLLKTRDFLNSDLDNIEEEDGFHQSLKSFVPNAEVDIVWLLEEEKRITAMVKSAADYFHGNPGKDEGLRLFVIVRDFLIILDKACKEVENVAKKPNRATRKEEMVMKLSSESQQSHSLPQAIN